MADHNDQIYQELLDEKMPLLPTGIFKGMHHDIDLENNNLDVLDFGGPEDDAACLSSITTFLANLLLFLAATTGVLASVALQVLSAFMVALTPADLTRSFWPLFACCGLVIGATYLKALLSCWIRAKMPFRMALQIVFTVTALTVLGVSVLIQLVGLACAFAGLIPMPRVYAWMVAAQPVLDAMFPKDLSIEQLVLALQNEGL